MQTLKKNPRDPAVDCRYVQAMMNLWSLYSTRSFRLVIWDWIVSNKEECWFWDPMISFNWLFSTLVFKCEKSIVELQCLTLESIYLVYPPFSCECSEDLLDVTVAALVFLIGFWFNLVETAFQQMISICCLWQTRCYGFH